MNNRRIILCALSVSAMGLILFSTGRGAAQTKPADKPRFVILTGDSFGFKDGDKTYLAGMKAEDFRKQFGAPDKTTDDTVYYGQAGLDVIITEGRCSKFVFHAVPETYEDEKMSFAAASVATDSGVHAGMTQEQVLQAAGAKPRKANAGELLILDYPWGAVFFKGDHIHLIISAEAQAKVARNKQPAPVAVPPEQIEGRVIQIIAKQVELDPSKISRTSNLTKDLKLDDLDRTELAMSIEDVLHVKIPDEDAFRFQTVGELVDFIKEHSSK